MTSRGWCFTLNARDEEESDKFCLQEEPLGGLPPGARFLIYQTELGENTQRVHLQGFVYFKNPARMPKKLYGSRAHWEKQRGTFDEAAAYCDWDAYEKMHGEPKSGEVLAGPWEFGERLHQGKSLDFMMAVDRELDTVEQFKTAKQEFKARVREVMEKLQKGWDCGAESMHVQGLLNELILLIEAY